MVDAVENDSELSGKFKQRSQTELKKRDPAVAKYESWLHKEIGVRFKALDKKGDVTEEEKIILAMAKKDKMERTENVFRTIWKYCKDHLAGGYRMVDKHIEDLMNPDVEVSPLLKFYNELAEHTNLRLPS